MSAQTTSWPVSDRHAPTTSPTYPVPMTEMFRSASGWPYGSVRAECSVHVRYLARVCRLAPLPRVGKRAADVIVVEGYQPPSDPRLHLLQPHCELAVDHLHF